MSEVILEFAQPFLDELEAQQLDSFENIRKMVVLAISAWNLSLLNPPERTRELQKMKQTISEPEGLDSSFAKQLSFILERMIQRKLDRFDAIKRLIVDWDYFRVSDGAHLNVVSTVLEGSEDVEQFERLLANKGGLSAANVGRREF